MTHNSELWNEHCASIQPVVSLNCTQRSCCSFAIMAAILWWTEHVCTFQNLECQLMTFQPKGFSLCARECVGVLVDYFSFEKRYKWLTDNCSLHQQNWDQISQMFLTCLLLFNVNLYPVWNVKCPLTDMFLPCRQYKSPKSDVRYQIC